MTGRVLVTARCRHKGHPLAELLATGEGLVVIRVDEYAVGHEQAGRVHYQIGGLFEAPLGDATDDYLAMCKCHRPHRVSGRAIAEAKAAGEFVVICDPLR